MKAFVKHFTFWMTMIVVIAGSVMTGINANRGDVGNSVVYGVLVLFMVFGFYFGFCLVLRPKKDEKPSDDNHHDKF